MNKKKNKDDDEKGRAKEEDRALFASFSYSTYLGEAAFQGAVKTCMHSRTGRGRQGDI